MNRPLDLLFVAPYPASPPTFGAQRRIDGLMRALARRHRITFVGLAPPWFDRDAVRRAMQEYCDEVTLLLWPEAAGLAKRLAQLRSLVSWHSYERAYMNTPALQRELHRTLRSRPFDVVSLETPSLAFSRVRLAPPGSPPPKVIVDAHNVEFDLARQYGQKSRGILRKLHHGANWRKMKYEEIQAWRGADGVAFTSPDDAGRARALVPSLRAAVVPNGVDTAVFRPRPDHPAPDGRTLVFFGTLNYYPNVDAVRWLLREIWPVVASRAPDAVLRIIGSKPPPDIVAEAGPRVEFAGLVDDLPRHLAAAAAVLVPLRIGGGTRLKILESMAMGKPIVSTRVGAEGIAARSGEELLIADDPDAFAEAVLRVLRDPALAHRLSSAGRALAERTYSWDAIAEELERFLSTIVSPGLEAAAPVPRVVAGR